ALARKTANAKLEELLVERNRAEEELADAAGRREQATAALYRLRSAADRLELRREAAEALVERLRAEPLRLPTVDDERLRTARGRRAEDEPGRSAAGCGPAARRPGRTARPGARRGGAGGAQVRGRLAGARRRRWLSHRLRRDCASRARRARGGTSPRRGRGRR